ncbi:MAG: type II toxin-antitoxin system RelE/ParE family toxin [Steroidobacteraceae bacterium]
MFTVIQSDAFRAWFEALADRQAKARIDARIRRVSLGNFGAAKGVGSSVSELRIDHGPGYRVYYARHGRSVVLLLCGGDKRTQAADIKRAIDLAAHWEMPSRPGKKE